MTMTKAKKLFSVQKPKAESGSDTQALSRMFLMTVGSTMTTAPRYWSVARDNWLYDFWKLEGNDLLAGAVATLVAKITTAEWYLEGPLRLVQLYRKLLLYQSEFGAGWGDMIGKWVQSYLSRDGGGVVEYHRASADDHIGAALGFAHLDESKLFPTGDPEFPFVYQATDVLRKMHRSQVVQILDMPSTKDSLRSVGFCSVSRTLTTASILMDVVKYKRERLSDLPPAGIMFINNMSEEQWEDLQQKYDARQRNQGNMVWRDVMVALGIDPEFPTSAEMFEFSTLIDGYDEKTAIEMAVYTFALAFRVDPSEFWPISGGALGTATEAELQAKKAKGKGVGIIFTAIERGLNGPFGLPRSVKFRFDYKDDEEDLATAKIDSVKIANIRRLWQPAKGAGNPMGEQVKPLDRSPNLPTEFKAVTEDAGEAEDGQRDKEDSRRQEDSSAPDDQFEQAEEIDMSGMITTEEARWMLAREGVIPKEWVPDFSVAQERVYDIRRYGPMVRMYRDGGVQPLFCGSGRKS